MRDIATPGVCAATAHASREPGSSASRSLSKLLATLVDCTSTTGVAPLTVMLSLSPPGLNSTFTVAMKPTPTRIPSRAIAPNPASSKASLWSPIGTLEKRKKPFWSVTETLVPINDGPESVTVTPGSTDLVLSVTVPLIAPVVEVTVWAIAGGAMHASMTMRDTMRVTRAISAPPRVDLLLTDELHPGEGILAGELVVAGREPVGLDDVGDDVEHFLLGKRARRILGHRRLDAREQRRDVLVLPLGQERVSPELGPHGAAVVARGALAVVRRAP